MEIQCEYTEVNPQTAIHMGACLGGRHGVNFGEPPCPLNQSAGIHPRSLDNGMPMPRYNGRVGGKQWRLI